MSYQTIFWLLNIKVLYMSSNQYVWYNNHKVTIINNKKLNSFKNGTTKKYSKIFLLP